MRINQPPIVQQSITNQTANYYNGVPEELLNINNWNIISNSTALNKGKYLIIASCTLTLPSGSGSDIEILNMTNDRIYINTNGNKVDGDSYTELEMVAKQYVRFVYASQEIGFYTISGRNNLRIKLSPYPGNPSLWIEDGRLFNNVNGTPLTPVISNAIISQKLGRDNRNGLYFDGSGTQELNYPSFLQNTIGATLYIVYDTESRNYNLTRTRALDDYYRFIGNGLGYLGTFLGARREAYPNTVMPDTGYHCVSIHAGRPNVNEVSVYEAGLNNSSRGKLSNVNYDSGNLFRIATNDKAYKGIIYLVLCYSEYIPFNGSVHNTIMQKIKNNYPSLLFTL